MGKKQMMAITFFCMLFSNELLSAPMLDASKSSNTPTEFFYTVDGSPITFQADPLIFNLIFGAPWNVVFSVTESRGVLGADSLTIDYLAFHAIALHAEDGGNGQVFNGSFYVDGAIHKSSRNILLGDSALLAHGSHFDKFNAALLITAIDNVGNITDNPPNQLAYQFSFTGTHIIAEPASIALLLIGALGLFWRISRAP